MNSLEELEFDPKRAAMILKQHDTLSSRVEGIQGDLDDITNKLESANSALGAAKEELKKRAETLAVARKLDETLLGIDGIEGIRDAVVGISSKHGLNPQEALEHFRKDTPSEL